jgi:membrane protease YdiL (CAAX protease family)
MRTVFFDRGGTLRGGWRVIIFLMAFAGVGAILSVVSLRTLETLNVDFAGSSASLLLNALLSMITAVIVGWLCARYLEGLPFRSLGVSLTGKWKTHLSIGILFGAVTLVLAVLPVFLAGAVTFDGNLSAGPGDIVSSLAMSLLVFGAAAAFEETLFRGYVLQTLARSGLAWLAIILPSIFFGVVHMGNPGSGVISTINTMLAGIWFGVAYLKTRDLWCVWGLHLMWNWTQGSVFGIEVSGITNVAPTPILREIDHGPPWLTGLEYGIEGGIACTIAIVISTVLIYKLPALAPDPELLRLTTPGDLPTSDLP